MALKSTLTAIAAAAALGSLVLVGVSDNAEAHGRYYGPGFGVYGPGVAFSFGYPAYGYYARPYRYRYHYYPRRAYYPRYYRKRYYRHRPYRYY